MSFDAITYNEVSKAKLPIGAILDGIPNNNDWLSANGQKLNASSYSEVSTLLGSVYNDTEVKTSANDMIFNAQGAMREIVNSSGVSLIGNVSTQKVYSRNWPGGSSIQLSQLMTESLFRRKDGYNGLYGSVFLGIGGISASAGGQDSQTPGQCVSVGSMNGKIYMYNDFGYWNFVGSSTSTVWNHGSLQSYKPDGTDYAEYFSPTLAAARTTDRRIMVLGGGLIILWNRNNSGSNVWTGPLISNDLGKNFSPLAASGVMPTTFSGNMVFFNGKFFATNSVADSKLYRTTPAAPTVWDAPAASGLPSDLYDQMKVVNNTLFIWKTGANTIYSSIDGTTFTARTITTNGVFIDIGFVGGNWVAFYQYTGDAIQTKYYTSLDLSAWTIRAFPSALFFIQGRNYNGTNNMSFATAEDGSVGYLITAHVHRYGFTTTDGLNWTMSCYDPLPCDTAKITTPTTQYCDAVYTAANQLLVWGDGANDLYAVRGGRVKISADGKYWGFSMLSNSKTNMLDQTYFPNTPAVDYSNNTALYSIYNRIRADGQNSIVQMYCQDGKGEHYLTGFEGTAKDAFTSYNAIKHSTGDYIYTAGIIFKVLADNSIVPLYFLTNSNANTFKNGAFQYSTSTPAVVFAGQNMFSSSYDTTNNLFFSSGDISTVAGWSQLAVDAIVFDVAPGQTNELLIAMDQERPTSKVRRYTVSSTTMVANGAAIAFDFNFANSGYFLGAPIWTGSKYLFSYRDTNNNSLFFRSATTWGGALSSNTTHNNFWNGVIFSVVSLISTSVAGTVYALAWGSGYAKIAMKSVDNGVNWTNTGLALRPTLSNPIETQMPHYFDGGCYFLLDGVHYVDATNLYSTARAPSENGKSAFVLNTAYYAEPNSVTGPSYVKPYWILRKSDTSDRVLVGFMMTPSSSLYVGGGISCQTVIVNGKTSGIVGKPMWQDRLITLSDTVTPTKPMRYSSFGASVIAGSDLLFWNKPSYVGVGSYTAGAVGNTFITSKHSTYLVNGRMFSKITTAGSNITYFDETGSYTIVPTTSMGISGAAGTKSGLTQTSAGVFAVFNGNGGQDRSMISFSVDGVKFDTVYIFPPNKRLFYDVDNPNIYQAINQPNVVAIPVFNSSSQTYSAADMVVSWLITTDGGRTWKDCVVEAPIYQDSYGAPSGGQYQYSYLDTSGNILSKVGGLTATSYQSAFSKSYKLLKKDPTIIRLPASGGRIIKVK